MKLLALIPLLLIGATAQAATIDIGTPSTIRTGPEDRWYFFPPKGYTDVTFPVNHERPINVPSSKGRVPVVLGQKTPPNINALGAAAVNLAKRAGPIGVGLTIAGLLCESALICTSPEHPETWSVKEPAVTDPAFPPSHDQGTVYRSDASPTPYPTPQAACSGVGAPHPAWGQYVYKSPGDGYVLGRCQPVNAPGVSGSLNIQKIAGVCATGYLLVSGRCIDPNAPEDGYRPITPGDWDNAKNNPGLRTPDIIPDLIRGEEPVPVETPAIDPKTVPGPGGRTTETVRDGNGTAIGTKITDTTITITPTGPTTVEVTETTTTTETNITNNTTTITNTETKLPGNEDQSEKPKEDQDIETDNVQDKDLETYEVPDTFDHESWGGGSCPGDQAISVMGKSITVPIHHICDGLAMLRPVVLIIAFLAAAYIMSGAIRQ